MWDTKGLRVDRTPASARTLSTGTHLRSSSSGDLLKSASSQTGSLGCAGGSLNEGAGPAAFAFTSINAAHSGQQVAPVICGRGDRPGP